VNVFTHFNINGDVKEKIKKQLTHFVSAVFIIYVNIFYFTSLVNV